MYTCSVKLILLWIASVTVLGQVGAGPATTTGDAALALSRTKKESQLQSVQVSTHGTSTEELNVTQANSTSRASAMDLAHRIAGPGVVVSGAEMSSGELAQFGFFQGGLPSLSLDSGIVLSTGYVWDSAAWANKREPRELPFTYPGDAALDQLTQPNQTTYDVAALTIQFKCPVNSLVSVEYVFGSMEYPNVGQWDDVAAIWLANASDWANGDERVNVALVEGEPVSVSRINCDKRLRDQGVKKHCQYLQDNRNENARGGMKGITVPLSSRVVKVAGGVAHKIRFAIADGYDGKDSSWLFVKENSLVCVPYTEQPSASPSLSPTSAPSAIPSQVPTLSQEPSMFPSNLPSLQPSTGPTSHPSLEPSSSPSTAPSGAPSSSPTSSFSPTIHITKLGTCYRRVAKKCRSTCADQTKDGRTKAQSCVKRQAQQLCAAGFSFEARSAYWNTLYEAFEDRECAVPRKENDTTTSGGNDVETVPGDKSSSDTPKTPDTEEKDCSRLRV